MEINQKQAVQRVMDLIAIRGGSCSEQDVAAWICQQLQDAGIPQSAVSFDTAHRRSPQGGTTGNLIVKLKGTKRGPRRLLMAHMDTVPLAVDSVPVLDGDWIRPQSKQTALGGDNRAGCAVVLTAILELLRSGADYPPLTLLFTVQEEIGLRGAKFLTASKLGKPALCFNWDGRDPALLINGAVGASNLTIDITGHASHAGVHPEHGVNAAVVASMAIASLQRKGWHGLVRKQGQRGTSNLGAINGGGATNVVMPAVTIEAEARSHDSEFRRQIVAAWKEAFEWAVNSLSNSRKEFGTLTFDEDARYEPFLIDERSECIVMAAEAAKAVGLSPTISACDGGLDANWLAAHGYPAVTLGCGQHAIHTVDETLLVPDYLKACQMGLLLAAGDG